ncbi:DUF4276 family protein [Prochlorothrix hollandica]|uniref:DUF4276 family protein n=1 Tax=Prochlorothrix hollandica TaxID=1223 RepID=UPI0028F4307B
MDTLFITSDPSTQTFPLLKTPSTLGFRDLCQSVRQTAPSKRIMAQFPDYGKAKSTFGPQLAEKIGLQVIRSTCPHFNEWLSKLESLGGA